MSPKEVKPGRTIEGGWKGGETIAKGYTPGRGYKPDAAVVSPKLPIGGTVVVSPTASGGKVSGGDGAGGSNKGGGESEKK